jgi:hypothetical protein
MLTDADGCCRMLPYADGCCRMLTDADGCWRMLPYAVYIGGGGGGRRNARNAGSLMQKYKFWRRFWYKRTNTDLLLVFSLPQRRPRRPR